MPPPPPVDGYAVPEAYQVVPMIPAGLPLVLRESRRKRAVRLGVAPLVVLLLAACAGAAAFEGGESDASGIAVALLAGFVVIAVVAGVRWWATTNSGPMLGAGPDGLWVRLNRARGPALFLPWKEVARITVERSPFTTVLWVQPTRLDGPVGHSLPVPVGDGTGSVPDVLGNLKRYATQTAIA